MRLGRAVVFSGGGGDETEKGREREKKWSLICHNAQVG